MLELTLIQLDFYYRYVLVCKNNLFSNTRFACCVIIALIVSSIQTCISFYAMDFGPSRDPEIMHFWKLAKEALEIKYKNYPFGVVNGVSLSIFNSSIQYLHIDIKDSPRMWLSEMSCMIIIAVVYSIVIFSTFKIRQTLKENDRRRGRKESKRISIIIPIKANF